MLDIGAGSGFHSLFLLEAAEHVIAVEPDGRLRRQLFARFSQKLDRKISVLAGDAETMLLPDASVDLAYARFAYFFGTDECLPGLAEVSRVLKPNGHFVIIDVLPEFGAWGLFAAEAYPQIFHKNYHADHAAFFQKHGFSTHRIETIFRAPNQEVLEAVFRMDFPHNWEALMRKAKALEFTYGIAVFHRQASRNAVK